MWDPLPKLNQGGGGGGEEKKTKSPVWDPPTVLNGGPPPKLNPGGGQGHPDLGPLRQEGSRPPPT